MVIRFSIGRAHGALVVRQGSGGGGCSSWQPVASEAGGWIHDDTRIGWERLQLEHPFVYKSIALFLLVFLDLFGFFC